VDKSNFNPASTIAWIAGLCPNLFENDHRPSPITGGADRTKRCHLRVFRARAAIMGRPQDGRSAAFAAHFFPNSLKCEPFGQAHSKTWERICQRVHATGSAAGGRIGKEVI
jgi:hypothetical protein